MLDLETLATSSNAVVASIGAVEFEPYPKSPIAKPFYAILSDWKAQMNVGRSVDPDTVKFWLQQDPIAIKELLKPEGDGAVKTIEALHEFAHFVGDGKDVWIWGNGADFDNIILGSLYEDFGVKRPWSYGRNRCYRTLKNILPEVKVTRAGTHHNALDDAAYQAVCMQKMLSEFNKQNNITGFPLRMF
jgi:exodeoxyribonuclease VIII